MRLYPRDVSDPRHRAEAQRAQVSPRRVKAHVHVRVRYEYSRRELLELGILADGDKLC